MKSVILAVTKSEQVIRFLLSFSDRLFSPLRFADDLFNVDTIRKNFHVGLLIMESQALENLTEEERKIFYKLNCPRIIITRFQRAHYLLLMPQINVVNISDTENTHKIADILNQSFKPYIPANRARSGDSVAFITRNPHMKEILKIAERAARFNTQVLLLGESGTGKDILSRYIHQHSSRNGRPMIKINCATIPANLLEAELFGYRRGAFTNAFTDKIGKIQLANGSTLFLDEIGELPFALQSKLLRMLENQEIDVLGMPAPLKVDVRIIAATNRDLHREVLEKKFRSDLYYRLNVVTLHLPPLRERPEDIPLLINHFIRIFNKQYGKQVKQVKETIVQPALEYSWPGNIRELHNFINRIILQTKSMYLRAENFRQEIQKLQQKDAFPDPGTKLEHYLENAEKYHLINVMIQTNYRLTDTAEKLGISRTSLFRRLKKYNINVKQLKASEER
ncbi:MAG: sigma-54 dependent transcriptional regulator [Calditrichia bacterium]